MASTSACAGPMQGQDLRGDDPEQCDGEHGEVEPGGGELPGCAPRPARVGGEPVDENETGENEAADQDDDVPGADQEQRSSGPVPVGGEVPESADRSRLGAVAGGGCGGVIGE